MVQEGVDDLDSEEGKSMKRNCIESHLMQFEGGR